MKHGPTRGDLRFRLAFSLAGLALMAYALSRHGVRGMAWFEIVVFAGAFFGGTALWTLWKLLSGPGR
jgi:hypothetical protein